MGYLITVVAFSMFISALCSLMEACLLSLSRSDIAEISLKKPWLSGIWNRFKANIQKPIAVILIINTIAHTTGASLSGAQFDELFGSKWIILFSVLFSFTMIQWTEILPKTLGVRYNRRIANISALPLLFFVKLFTPVIWFIELLNKPFTGKRREQDSFDTIKEISVLSRMAFVNNLISKDQEKIISRTIGLAHKKVKDLMIDKKDMKCLNDAMTMMEALVEAHIHNHTRYPLVKSSRPDTVLGYINFKDIISALRINPRDPSLKGITRPIVTFGENDDFSLLFKTMTDSHQHIAVVRNSRNELAGLITIEDVIEEIIGDIEDEYDKLPLIFYPITDTRYVVGGGVAVDVLNRKLGTGLDRPDYTISRWIREKYGAEQRPGMTHRSGKVLIIIKKISRSSISEVIVEKTPEKEEENSGKGGQSAGQT